MAENLTPSGSTPCAHRQHCILSFTSPHRYSPPPDTADSAAPQYTRFDGASLLFRSHHRIDILRDAVGPAEQRYPSPATTAENGLLPPPP
uniref:Uncharacterized protein n=1 Tax=Arundo donax TaxID=35708 RepID=A0A0A8XWM9_ARUDO